MRTLGKVAASLLGGALSSTYLLGKVGPTVRRKKKVEGQNGQLTCEIHEKKEKIENTPNDSRIKGYMFEVPFYNVNVNNEKTMKHDI